MREDYSAGGTAWDYCPTTRPRSRAYRWGEDGIAGWSDDRQLWCLALRVERRDPILKERMFGLTNGEGNHGEEVKELWWYLDGTPTHSYMRMLNKSRRRPTLTPTLVAENGTTQGKNLPEYEIADTLMFAEGRYHRDGGIRQGRPRRRLMRVTLVNRGRTTRNLHVLPQNRARNTWSWGK